MPAFLHLDSNMLGASGDKQVNSNIVQWKVDFVVLIRTSFILDFLEGKELFNKILR